MTEVLVQAAGALLILACFALHLSTQGAGDQSRLYLAGNCVGSVMVAVTSIGPRQWGTVLLESAWAVIAAYFLVRAVMTSGRSPGPVWRSGRRPRRRGRHRAGRSSAGPRS